MRLFKKRDKQELASEATGGNTTEKNGAPTQSAGALVRKKKKRRKKIIIAIVVIILVFLFAKQKMNAGAQVIDVTNQYLNYEVVQQDITQTITGSGSIEPADSYTVTSLLEGDILKAPFEEGDIVKKDSVLYQIDTSKMQSSIEQSKISLSQSKRSYADAQKSINDLKIKANESGKIALLDVKVGDSVNAGETVATIRDSATMKLELPFVSAEATNFYVGQPAVVTLDGSFETLSGTVSKVAATETVSVGNIITRTVTIDVKNPGGIASGQAATGMVGGATSTSNGTFDFKADKTVTAMSSGKVASLHVKEGDAVAKDDVIITLTNDSLESAAANSSDGVRNSEIALQDLYDKLEDYTITSPIAGTIITKSYKAGDTMESGKALCVIYDLSYLIINLNVDELDISDVSVGQRVVVTAEALGDKEYEGYVTNININGKSENGVTTYPVEIRIDETEGLLPGMNVEAQIMIAERSNVMSIPASAIVRGDRVLVQTDAGEAPAPEDGVPEGFTYITVEAGISDGNFIEIQSGLSVGDVIAYQEAEVDYGMDMMFYGGVG